jgi:hypothetical protein
MEVMTVVSYLSRYARLFDGTRSLISADFEAALGSDPVESRPTTKPLMPMRNNALSPDGGRS